MKRYHIGVALCGADLAGITHVGVLFALERLGIKPSVIAGSSSGSLIASMYAHGCSMDDFQKFVSKFPAFRLVDYGFPLVSSTVNTVRNTWGSKEISVPHGVIRGAKLEKYIRRVHRDRLLKMPLYVVATDLFTTSAVVFTNEEQAVKQGFAQKSTDLPREIYGSCAMPGLLTPVRHRGWMLVDGGVRDQVPVSILQQVGCDKIFAVHIHSLSEAWRPVTTIDVIQRSLLTVIDEAVEHSDLTGRNVLVIKPHELKPASWLSCRKPMAQNIELGYQYVMDNKDKILKFVDTTI